MRFIFIVLFLVLFGSISMAGVGDVYYCDMTNFVLNKNHKIQRFETQKFKFKWNKSQMKFSKGGYFEDVSIKIIWEVDNMDMFEASENGMNLMFKKGEFFFSQTGFDQVMSVSAKCDKF